MVTKYINQPLGMGNTFAPSRKEWVTAALAGGSLALGLGTSIFGGASAASAARKAAERQKEEEAKENAWYKRRYYENYLDTAAGQALVNRAREYAKENWKRESGKQAVTGGTDAAAAIAKEQGNKMVGDTIANIAAADQQRKDNVDNIHQQNQQKFAQMDMAREANRAQSITQAAQGASNALMSAAGALGNAGAAKSASIKGGSNNGTPVVQTNSQSAATPNGGKGVVTADDLAENWEKYGV